MTLSEPAATVLLVLGIGVAAAALGLRQWYERRHRETELSDEDVRHFARQDMRRAVAGIVLVLLALGIAVGSQLKHIKEGRANGWFIAVWLAIFVLVLALLWLALLDWTATWLYARRHHRALARQRVRYLRDARRRRAYPGNGRGSSENPLDDSATS